MIGKHNNELYMVCDNCATDLDGMFMPDEFHMIIDTAEKAGWKFRKEPDGLAHYCPFCG